MEPCSSRTWPDGAWISSDSLPVIVATPLRSHNAHAYARFILIEIGSPVGAHILIGQPRQGGVDDGFPRAREDLVRSLRPRHEGRASRDIDQPGEHLVGGRALSGPDEVPQRGMVGDDVRDSIGAGMAIVEPNVARDVLAEVIGGDVHQFAGIQGAPSQFRADRSVGGDALEAEARRMHGLVAIFAAMVPRRRMPGQRDIDIGEVTIRR